MVGKVTSSPSRSFVRSPRCKQSMMRINNNLWHDLCPLCNSSTIVKLGSIQYDQSVLFSSTEIELLNGAELWRCNGCKSGFTQNAIQYDDVIELYTNNDSYRRWENVAFVDSKTPEVVAALGAVFSDGGNVVDVGCNTGELLDFAKSFGCRTAGVELSRGSRAALKQKGHTVTDSLADVQDQSADVITGFDLLEHLHDVNAFFSLCRKKLRVGGKLILLTGNISCLSSRLAGANWWYVRYPEHIRFVSEYFVRYRSGLELLQAIPTYASIGYRTNVARAVASLALRAPFGKYRGLPSIGTDHYLYILRK